MVRRKAIGASVAAALVFSTLLLGNSALLAASDQRERLAISANSESLLADAATLQSGTEGLGLLNSLQNYLSSRILQCNVADKAVALFIGTLFATGRKDGVTVNESADANPASAQQDNLTLLVPYNGSLLNGINVNLRIESTGRSADGSVTYEKSELHHLNLPVWLESMDSFCEASLGSVSTFLQEQSFTSCNGTAIGPALASIEDTLKTEASAQGLSFSMDYRIDESAGCVVVFTNQVAQDGANGPEGPFNVQVQQEGSVPVRAGG